MERNIKKTTPGYRRLFLDYLSEYAKSEHKTIFVTSHIIQDLENLIDEFIISLPE